MVAAFHQATNLPGQLIGLGLGRVVLGLQGPPTLVEVQNSVHVGLSRFVVAFGKAGQNVGGLLFKNRKLQHNAAKVVF